MATDKDLDIIARDSRDITVTALDRRTKLPFNLSLYQALFVVKSERTDTLENAKIVKKTAGLVGGGVAQITIVDAAKGIFEIHLLSPDTALPPAVYRYTVILVRNSDSKRFTIAKGAFQVLEAEVDEPVV
jgi:hypothetical protein